jgi:hypothetical protein
MMIALPRIQHPQLQQHQHQHQQPPAPLVSGRSATAARGRSMSRRHNRLPPFLVPAASSSSLSEEDPASSAASDPQQQPKARRRRTSSTRPTAPRQPQGQRATSSAPRILRRLSHSLIRRRHHRHRDASRTNSRSYGSGGGAAALSLSASASEPNAVTFLQQACPREVVPLVLAYAGPQVAQALARSNHFWSDLMNDDATWKVQCQELYKVRKCHSVVSLLASRF